MGVHVGDEALQRPHPLSKPRRQPVPLRSGHDPGDRVDGKVRIAMGGAERHSSVANMTAHLAAQKLEIAPTYRCQDLIVGFGVGQRLVIGSP